ncbi:MAG TPA: isocitrate lyase/phosphoenolpyruvate mutase family protein [Jatrophihabitans sp.]|jgi:2-methylisocitrate lyase-like PEP mutase family enzyme|uniref:isocitrate lyase/PEP mutase family protein n=1 Tax=Jatrophihabitans sp. TaxID=1932789 RepID=UPI002EFF77BD
MSRLGPQDRAKLLLQLHSSGVLVMPNAWDVASAAVFAQAGARAVATTSAGLAWSLGYRDGEQVPRADLFRLLRRIAEVVDVPVSADIEAGFGADESQVGQTVTAVLEAGVVGINIEDAPPGGSGLFDLPVAAGRVAAARDAAVAAGVPDLVINARTDVYMRGIGDPAERPAEVLRRAHAFAAAGADCVFVPALSDLQVLSDLVRRSPLPISVVTTAGGASVAQLQAAGVRRITVGPALARAAYTTASELAHELLDSGTLTASSPWLGYDSLNALLPTVPTKE